MRPFELVTGKHRDTVVGEGIVFRDGAVAMRWLTRTADEPTIAFPGPDGIEAVKKMLVHETANTSIKYVHLNR